MSTWNVYTQESGVGWVFDNTIPRPHEDVENRTASTQVKVSLANGSMGYVTPETKTMKEQIPFTWFLDYDGDLKTQLQTYIDAGDDIQIVTHRGDTIYEGRFVDVTSKWLVGVEDEYEVRATLEQMSL